MNILSTIDICMERIRARFSQYHVEINPTPDESHFFEAVVYGVDEDDVGPVTDLIHELDYKYVRPLGSLLVPMVVDAEDTEEYYPDVLQHLENARLQSALQKVMPILTGMEFDVYRMDWDSGPNEESNDKVASDTELALAA